MRTLFFSFLVLLPFLTHLGRSSPMVSEAALRPLHRNLAGGLADSWRTQVLHATQTMREFHGLPEAEKARRVRDPHHQQNLVNAGRTYREWLGNRAGRKEGGTDPQAKAMYADLTKHVANSKWFRSALSLPRHRDLGVD